ncbi:undecaprenyl-diphosphate phosphatase [Candidatus Curtissbacteria bacterium]|nr:undecaprenyl-diphosphate phosphatase [Candidatus Curtissbacteria bacterium]
MDFFFSVIAGAIQGLTEFLPVSSTGHLIILEAIFGLSPEKFGLAFDASLHLGTLLALAIFFFRDYLRALKDRNLLLKLTVGTIPAVVLGLAFESLIESTLRQILIVAGGLIIFSFVMLIAEKVNKKSKQKSQITIKDAFIMGVFQSIALIPGVSRSGSTISGGLLLGLKREEAARFAFLLSGPIIAGAGTKKFLEVLTADATGSSLGIFVIGISSSGIFGYLTIKYFLKYVSKNSLALFIIYRLILGFVLIVLALYSPSY